MNGEYRHNLDNKGRITIPSRIRSEMGDVIYITISTDKCLSIYSKVVWEKLSKKVNELPFYKQNDLRPIFSHAAKCEIDSQGRILIPSYLREWAGLKKNVIIIGNNNHAEIWSTDNWDSFIKSSFISDNLYTAMEDLNF